MVDAHGFRKYDKTSMVPFTTQSLGGPVGKRDLYTGPFPKPSQLANQMGMGIREALRTFTVPEQIVYKPCMSIINPSSDFEPETQIRRSAQTPTSRLQLSHVFGYHHGLLTPNLFSNGSYLVWVVAKLVIFQNVKTKKQKFFRGHEGSICAFCVTDGWPRRLWGVRKPPLRPSLGN